MRPLGTELDTAGAHLSMPLGRRGAAGRHKEYNTRLPTQPGCRPRHRTDRLGQAEFQQLDRCKVTDITANAFGGIEQHMRFGAKGVTQHP